jgi:hypothetical protein
MKPARLSIYLLTALALSAAFVPAHWRYRQRITTAASPVTRVTLDRAAYDGASPGFDDLRVVRDGGGEVPYLFAVAGAMQQTETFPIRIVNQEWRAGTLFATLEFAGAGIGREPHNELRLDVTRVDFRSRVTIEASDDQRQWAFLRHSAYIFRYHADDGQVVEHTTLHYPDSRRRYLRLTLSNWPEPAGFTGATVLFNHSAEARRSEIWSVENPAATNSCTVLDTASSAPRDRAVLTPDAAGPPVFHRGVTMWQSADGKSWGWLGTGAIYRIQGEESLTVDFPETRLRWQKLCIFQGDDRPVRLSRIRLLGVDRMVSFRSEAPGTYWLYYGAPPASPPVYDLARTAGPDFATAGVGSLSPRESNPAYEPPPQATRPWTERYPGFLYAALAVAVAGLGWMALRLLRP